MTAAGQRFCPSCGTTLPAMATAQAAVPATAQAAVPAPAQAAMPAPQPPPYVAPVQPAWAMPPPTATAAPARSTASPAMLLVGGLVIAAIVGVAILAMNNGSKGLPGSSGSSGSPGSSASFGCVGLPGCNGSGLPPIASVSPSRVTGYPGSLSFSPKTIGCPGQPFTTTVVLPSSVKGTDQITYQIDDTTIITRAATDFGVTKQADGTWSGSTDNPDGSVNCSMGPGFHTATLLDSGGNVLAQTSFMFVMLASPTPQLTPAPFSVGVTTIEPSSFSCSAPAVDVRLALQLSASFAGSTVVTLEFDGVPSTTLTTVAAEFVQQADGSWLDSSTVSSSSLCVAFSVGKHSIGASDAAGKVITEGTFTVKP
jgi:hypothetical protein